MKIQFLINCDFTDVIVKGSLDLRGAKIDTKTFKSLQSALSATDPTKTRVLLDSATTLIQENEAYLPITHEILDIKEGHILELVKSETSQINLSTPSKTNVDIEKLKKTVELSSKLVENMLQLVSYKDTDPDTRLGIFLADKLQKMFPNLQSSILKAIKKIKVAKILIFITKKSSYKTISNY